MPPILISYQALLDPDVNLDSSIEEAFGELGLGLLLITDVPGHPQARQKLLPLAVEFSALPDKIKSLYEDPQSRYSFGWSLGRESLRPGVPDTAKGSYYANPCRDDMGVEADAASLVAQYPGYYRPNIWPREHLPELEGAFKRLGQLILDVGLLLMERCDRYVANRHASHSANRLTSILRRSRCPKGRLLHYFPVIPLDSKDTCDNNGSPESDTASSSPNPVHADADACAAAPANHSTARGAEENPVVTNHAAQTANGSLRKVCAVQEEEDYSGWCGWHTDHGSLTGLTAAMYHRAGVEVPCPDPSAGLYARDRTGQVVQVRIPADALAFQVGEALQVHSGGLLRATPHCVRAASGPAAAGVTRSTFALFMQPDVRELLEPPPGVTAQQVEVGQWRLGIDFGTFSELTFDRYYN